MPKLDHENLKHIAKTVYLPGVIRGLHQEGEDVARENWDTADVEFDSTYSPVRFDATYSPYGEIRNNVPIYYHCRDDVEERENGALEEAATGFDIGDNVILMCELSESSGTEGDTPGKFQFETVRVVGHQSGPKKCRPGYIFVFCRAKNKDSDSEYTEYVTVFKTRQGEVLGDLNKPGPVDEEQEDYVFPCPRAEIEPWLESYLLNKQPEDQVDIDGGSEIRFNQRWPCEELFEKERVEEINGQLFEAGGTPEWTSALEGHGILGGSEESPSERKITGHSPWILNPTFQFFEDLVKKLQGVRNTNFSDVMEQAREFTNKDWEGPGVVSDEREWLLTNPRPVNPLWDHLTGESLHYQVGYGESQIFLCVRQPVPLPSGGIMIAQYCTDPIYYYPRATLPPDLANWGLPGYMGHAADKVAMLQSTPSQGGGIGSMQAAQTASTAGAIGAQAGMGDNLLVFIYLKMVHEGCFHADIYPAIEEKPWLSPGSFYYTQRRNPKFPEEPPVQTALNTRHEKHSAWARYDNWHNTIEMVVAIKEANPTWFMDCYASQQTWDRYILDTPIGQMLYAAPHFKLFTQWSTWFPYAEVPMSQDDVAARQDWPLRTQMWQSQRQNEAGLFQIYVVHRQGITLNIYNDPEWDFGREWYVVQSALTPPWDNLPSLEEVPDFEFEWVPEAGDQKILNVPAQDDFVGFARHPDSGEQTHISNMSQEEILEQVNNLVFITTHEDSESSDLHDPISFSWDRNEMEVMASADTWGTLFEKTAGYRCTDQERNPELEEAIAALIDKTLTEAGYGTSGFPEMDIKARMI